jgi:hypothetical protein
MYPLLGGGRSTPVPPTQLSKRICGAPTSARSARCATSSSPSPLVRQGWGAGTATHGAGGTPLGSPYFLGHVGPPGRRATRRAGLRGFLWALSGEALVDSWLCGEGERDPRAGSHRAHGERNNGLPLPCLVQ